MAAAAIALHSGQRNPNSPITSLCNTHIDPLSFSKHQFYMIKDNFEQFFYVTIFKDKNILIWKEHIVLWWFILDI